MPATTIVSPPSGRANTNVSAAAAAATVTLAAPGANLRWVVRGVYADVACIGTAAVQLVVTCQDAVPNVLFKGQLNAAVNASDRIQMSGMALTADVNQAVTLSVSAGVAAATQSVTIDAFTEPMSVGQVA